MLDRELLERLVFPLGEKTKDEVRREAIRLDLPGATKGESQELCFVPSGRYTSFVAERAPGRLRPGRILDENGQTVGQHDGIHAFTIGQRKNLGVALGRRSYVVGLHADSACVELGPREKLLCRAAWLSDVTLARGWSLPMACDAAVRYRGDLTPAELRPLADGGVEVSFEAPVAAVVPGQFAVFYQAERVLGGGLIRRALAAVEQRGVA